MEKKMLNKMVRGIYEAVADSGITSHIYKDETWAKVYELRDIAETALLKGLRIVITDVETDATSKRYAASIEDEITGEQVGGGCIVACFAGSVSRPWERYDVCATWWANE